jgi:hypothetical protein
MKETKTYGSKERQAEEKEWEDTDREGLVEDQSDLGIQSHLDCSAQIQEIACQVPNPRVLIIYCL